METTIFTQAAQLGGTVFTVLIFLWYLTKRDTALGHLIDQGIEAGKENTKANLDLALALQKLTEVIERNSGVNTTNTVKVDENVVAVKENTKSIKENTGVMDKTNGKH